jgi:ParB-like chromosome segregation protein Spo0J
MKSFEGPDGTILQDTPVELRLTGKEDKPYQLVKGFRRHKAVTVVAAKFGLKEPTIRAIVAELDGVEARVNNLAENVARQNLTTPDFAWGLWQLKLEGRRNGIELSGTAIAARLGRNQAYVDKLLSIMANCKPNITRRWRETPKAITVLSMLAVSKMPKGEQDAAFAKLLGDVELKKDGGVKAKNGWLDATKKKARDFGEVLGTLERMGLIDTSGLDFEEHLELCIKVKETASHNQRRSIASQMDKAYKEALEQQAQPDLGPTGDEDDE